MFAARKARQEAERQRVAKALDTIKPVTAYVATEAAEVAQAVFHRSVRYHTNAKGRVVR